MWLAPHQLYIPVLWLEPASPFGKHSLLTHTLLSVVPNDLFYINGMNPLNPNNLDAAAIVRGNWLHVIQACAWNPNRKHPHCQCIAYRKRYHNHLPAEVQWTREWILAEIIKRKSNQTKFVWILSAKSKFTYVMAQVSIHNNDEIAIRMFDAMDVGCAQTKFRLTRSQ